MATQDKILILGWKLIFPIKKVFGKSHKPAYELLWIRLKELQPREPISVLLELNALGFL